MKNKPPDFSFTVGLFQPEDAPRVATLFRAVYGEGYPVKLYYNPEKLREAFRKKEVLPFIAKDKDGAMIGVLAIYRSSPFEGLYEIGSGIVLPQYRGFGIASRLHELVLSRKTLKNLKVEGLWGEAVANHFFMQKICANMGFRETALEVDLMPAEAYTQEKSAMGRVGAVVGFMTIAPKPHTVYLPKCYDEEFRFFYEDMDDSRTLENAHANVPADGATEIVPTMYDFARVARFAVQSIGPDFSRDFRATEKEIRDQNKILVCQAWVKLSCPWCSAAVDALRAQGYFLGGLLPRWFDDDGLLMQKILNPPNWEGLNLYSDRAKRFLDIAREDWKTTV
ncbi:MAG: GNAT family N-acetyltransferase [Desulfatibacillum sp.]|nr:GNAT family N-acetyltransferase [Desulfatibacillum sp.]